jgi:hypothetical protein
MTAMIIEVESVGNEGQGISGGSPARVVTP